MHLCATGAVQHGAAVLHCSLLGHHHRRCARERDTPGDHHTRRPPTSAAGAHSDPLNVAPLPTCNSLKILPVCLRHPCLDALGHAARCTSAYLPECTV